VSDKERRTREPTMLWDGVNPLIQGRVELRHDTLIPLLAKEAIEDFVLGQRVLYLRNSAVTTKSGYNKLNERETYDGSQ